MATLLKNRYQVMDVLSETGGFGQTFLAEDIDTPSRRRCVIKKLKPIADEDAFLLMQERFAREAAILERLGDGSGQIPKLYAYFTEEQEFYLVQEFIDGLTLRQRVREHVSLGQDAVVEILASLLNVLEYVHGQKIIHRDIKPDNIILRRQDGKPVLIDFGIVKEVMVLDEDGSPSFSIMAGTPGYTAPEQAAGRPVFASDLYSLGATAIYLLTGRNPQRMTDPATGNIDWQRHAPQVSAAFAAVLEKATQPNTSDRYRSVREMRDDLLKARYSGAIVAETESRPVETPVPEIAQAASSTTDPDLPARSRLPVYFGAVTIVLSLAILAGYLLFVRPVDPNAANGAINNGTTGPAQNTGSRNRPVAGASPNGNSAASPTATPVPSLAGSYFSGSDKLAIKSSDAKGLNFSITLTSGGCNGDISGRAIWVKQNLTATASIKKEGFTPDPAYPDMKAFCDLTLSFNQGKIKVAENSCTWFHGAASAFEGTYQRK